MPKLSPERLEYHRKRYAALKADPLAHAALLARKRAEYAERTATPEAKAEWAARQKEYHRRYVEKNGVARKRASARKSARKASGFATPHSETKGGRCECCNVEHAQLALDHDHATGAERGWLCDLCNRGIGYFKDNPERLEDAARYLRARRRRAHLRLA